MTTSTTPAEDIATWFAVQALLAREARALDERRFDDWLALYTDDATYLLPVADPGRRGEPALIRDSRAGMEERVYRLTQTLAHAQNPPSRTQHDVTNVEVLHSTTEELVVACHQSVHELRVGDVFHVGLGEQRSFHARCRYRISGSAGELRIREKRCELINREYPIYNLTFIF